MSDKQLKEIRRRLDEELSIERFENSYRESDEAATQFFQDMFTQLLNFDMKVSPTGQETWQELPVYEWRDSARAKTGRLFAESGNFRVIYIELETLTRTAERNSIQSLTRSDRREGWAIEGSFLTVFHAPEEDIWHLVTPYEEGTDDITTGRPVLRRYTLGEGETHRTVANALSSMDASKGRLAERIDEAFRVKPVTEDFYENYKSAFDTLSKELRRKGLEIEDADRYAHTTLNRLMFFYYLQKKGWIGDRKDFVRWFHQQYEESAEEDAFHEKWLSALFFEGMNSPEGGEINADLPPNVTSAIAGLPYMNGGLFQPTEEDERDTFLSDSALKSVIKEFLEQYNFTVTEESPYDIDVAVDPAMLGKIYESLIAEQERGDAGIFYTPRVEVDLMCRVSLYEQFCNYLGEKNQKSIVQFIFSEPEDWNNNYLNNTSEFEEVLHSLNIVDPACGSGAFLVGMKQVLTELYRKLGLSPDYSIKEQIISENLYGVDIKDWAVRVAEFRLWLSLMEGEDTLPDHRPVLPNFSFKIREGDSIVQTVNRELLSFKGIRREATGDVYQKLQEVYELKNQFFSGEAHLESEIEQAQRELLIAYLNSQISTLKKEASEQQTLSGGVSNSTNQNAQERLSRLKSLRDEIQSAAEDLFFWELDFPEVMLSGGFDVVIGNPPYVRHSDIISQNINPDRLAQMDNSKVSDVKGEYKKNLIKSVQNSFDLKPYKRSDLYLYFYFKGVDILQEGGTLTFVTSNSWLDANYGRRLQEGFLRHTQLKYILNNRRYRSFEEADVNTVITVAKRENEEQLSGKTAFTTLDVPYEEIATAEAIEPLLIKPEELGEIDFRGEKLQLSTNDKIRQILTKETTLWKLGGGSVTNLQGNGKPTPSGNYSEASWGKFVRAPDIYYKVLEQYGEQFKPLSEIANHIRRGVTSGANDFFYIPLPGEQSKFFESEFDEDAGTLDLRLRDRDVIDDFEQQGFDVTDPMFKIEHEYIMSPVNGSVDIDRHSFTYTDDAGTTWVPNYIIKSPKEIEGLSLSSEMVENVAVLTGESKNNLESGIKNYVEWGEKWEPNRGQKYPDRPTCSSRSPWYNITGLEPGDVLFPERVWSSYIAPANTNSVHDNKNLYGMHTEQSNKLCIAMNSATTWMFLEIGARSSLGEGVLDIDVNMAEDVLIPIPDSNSEAEVSGINLQGDIFKQMNAEPGEDLDLQDVSEDRMQIDDIALKDWVGMDEKMQEEVYGALLELVGERIERSESV